MEILVDSKTTISNSPKKFRVEADALPNRTAQLVAMNDLKDIAKRQQVSVVGKMLTVDKVEQVFVKGSGQSLSKREVVLANSTAACRCVLWEKHMNEVKEDQCYKIINANLRHPTGWW